VSREGTDAEDHDQGHGIAINLVLEVIDEKLKKVEGKGVAQTQEVLVDGRDQMIDTRNLNVADHLHPKI
jgi:hypothetical protein